MKQTRIQNPKQRLCSQQDLNILLPLLMRDLPNYANRVSQRTRRKSRAVDFFSYIL
ncbi:MAG: hypothetical protein H0X31_20300, partial [Nostocaceae cyanobacterium]|nr:hypothetical protein [Nostocaceae cyanobacterium]